MSESRKRNEVVSTRLSAEELAQIQQLADGKGISTFLRETVLAAGAASAVMVRRGDAWSVTAAPARLIEVGGRRSLRSADARRLAAALLEAAEVAEQRNLADEAWDVEHATGAA